LHVQETEVQNQDIRSEMKVETPQEQFLKLRIGWCEDMLCQENNIFVSIKYRDVEQITLVRPMGR